MKIFKNYKKLYEISKNNEKIILERKKELSDENVLLQEKVIEAGTTIAHLREEIAKLKIELEDTNGFLEQEKECSNALRKERTKLRGKITKLGGDWRDGKQ